MSLALSTDGMLNKVTETLRVMKHIKTCVKEDLLLIQCDVLTLKTHVNI